LQNYYIPVLSYVLINKGEAVALFYTGIKFTDGIELTYNIISQNVYNYLIENVIGAPQVCIARDICDKYKFNEKLKVAEDRCSSGAKVE